MKKILYASFAASCLLAACHPDPVEQPATYDPTPYALKIGDFPTPDLPADNKPTVAGVQLGRMLFYEKMLSKDEIAENAQLLMDSESFVKAN